LARLISFDIDGTLEVGDPPGCITMEMVRLAKGLGIIVGSCSDRMVSDQTRIWRDHQIPIQFTVLKHQLDLVKAQFAVDEYYHIGDTNMDRYYAERSGFKFLLTGAGVERLWIPQ
jgi:hypothetical protein